MRSIWFDFMYHSQVLGPIGLGGQYGRAFGTRENETAFRVLVITVALGVHECSTARANHTLSIEFRRLLPLSVAQRVGINKWWFFIMMEQCYVISAIILVSVFVQSMLTMMMMTGGGDWVKHWNEDE